jgi:hypothetical protein
MVVGGKHRCLVRSVVGKSEDEWAGVVEAELADELAAAAAAAATVTEEKVDKVPRLELLSSLAHAHSRTSPQLGQTADHPERGR